MLDETILFDELLKLLLADVVVMSAGLFALARLAGRVRDGEAEGVGVSGEEAFEERGLSGAGGAGEDEDGGLGS